MSEKNGDSPILHLRPPPIPTGGVAKWRQSGRATGLAVNPCNAEVAVFVKPSEEAMAKLEQSDPQSSSSSSNQNQTALKAFDQDKMVLFGKWKGMTKDLGEFYADCHAIFVSLQGIWTSQSRIFNLTALQNEHHSRDPLGSSSLFGFRQGHEDISAFGLGGAGVGGALRPAPQQVQYNRQIADEYAARLQVVTRNSNVDNHVRSHFLAVLRCFQLASTLYIPADGSGLSLVGEELLDWYNAYGDPNGAGDLADICKRVIAIGNAWDHEDYEEAVTQSILRGFFNEMTIPLLTALEKHDQPAVVAVSKIVIRHLSEFPRSYNVKVYRDETSFVSAHTKWRGNFRAEFSAHCRGQEREGGWLNYRDLPGQSLTAEDKNEETRAWESFFVGLVDLLTGEEEKIFVACQDWRNAVCTWGVLVEPRLKRDDLSIVVDRIVDEMPPDSTVVEEALQMNLLSGDIAKSLVNCNDLDIWLAAHLTDLLDKMCLIEDDEQAFEDPLRDHFLMSYADKLQANSGYWNIACTYLATCGAPGFGRIRAIVARVPLDLIRRPSVTGDTDDQGELSNLSPVDLSQVDEILGVCIDHKLEEEAREICRHHGEAASFAVRAGDERLLRVIADEILDLYVTQGAEAFSNAVNSLPSSLTAPRPNRKLFEPEEMDDAASSLPIDIDVTITNRYRFLGRFRDFLHATSEGDKTMAAQILLALFKTAIVPQGFWAILLMDSVPLLEDAEILISMDDTYELVRHMEEIAEGAEYNTDLYLGPLYRITQPKGGKHQAQASLDTGRFLPARAVREKAEEDLENGMKELLKSLDAFRLAAVRNISRASIHAS